MRDRLRKALIFVILAYALDWGLAGVFVALGGKLGSPQGAALLIVYMFGPLIAAILTQKVLCKEDVVRPLGVSFRLNGWFLVGLLLPPLLTLAALGVSLLWPDQYFAADKILNALPPSVPPEARAFFRPALYIPIALILGMIAGMTINALAAFGEELGWRGFLLRQLLPWGFWPSAFIIGAVWGLWHAPVILMGYNFPQHPQLGVLMMTLWAILFSPLICYVALRARSVIAASVMHGTFNGVYGVAIVYISGGNDLTTGLGVPGIMVLVIANLLLYLYDRYLAREPIMRKRIWEPYLSESEE